MKKFFVPASERDNFATFLKQWSLMKDPNKFISFYDRRTNGLYTKMEMPSSLDGMPMDFYMEAWAAYDKKGRVVYPFDDTFIACAAPEGKYANSLIGNSTVQFSAHKGAEDTFTDAIAGMMQNLEVDMPLAVEYNSSNYDVFRYAPTVIIAPREIWRNQGQLSYIHTAHAVTYGDTGFLSWFPYSVVDQRRYYIVAERPDSFIVLPWCFIRKNSTGLGNTVVINSFSFDSNGQGESIYTTLLNPEIWNKILIPLATKDFEQLKVELSNQVVPLELQIKIFNLQANQLIVAEVAKLKADKESNKRIVDDYLRIITDTKIKLDNLDKQIAHKEVELEQSIESGKLMEEIDRLQKLPYVTKVQFTANGLEIYTKPIQIDDGPMVGGYRVVYKSGTKSFLIYNEENPQTVGGKILAHPHIPQGDQPCFGNYTDIFFRFETLSFYIGMELLYKFLSTYNPNDAWGRRLQYWDSPYFYRDMKERGLQNLLGESHDIEYFAATGEHLPCVKMCPYCGSTQRQCTCIICPYCGRRASQCSCHICQTCGGNVYAGECHCERCPRCLQLIESCTCERCEVCGKIMDPYGDYSDLGCDCERCPKCEEIVCICDRCEICGGVLDPYNEWGDEIQTCTCNRCPEEYYDLVDTGPEGICRTDCEDFDCQWNCHPDNEDPYRPLTIQEEVIPGLENLDELLTITGLNDGPPFRIVEAYEPQAEITL
jgi:hypothetical protein